MTNEKPNRKEWITALNDSARFQLIGRVAAIFGVPLILGVLSWAMWLIVGMSQDVAVMKNQILTVASDPYHGADARRDAALFRNEVVNEDRRMDELADRIKTLEYGAANRRNEPRP